MNIQAKLDYTAVTLASSPGEKVTCHQRDLDSVGHKSDLTGSSLERAPREQAMVCRVTLPEILVIQAAGSKLANIPEKVH